MRWIELRDADAFRVLVSRYTSMVYATCRRVLRDSALAEDVAQECFETLACITQAPKGAFGAWLHRVATNRALDRLKGARRRRERENRYARELEHSRDKEIDWDDVHSFVDEVISELPDNLREPLVACYLEGLSHKAIAENIGVPRRTVTYRINKGIEQVRSSLKKRGVPIATSALATMLSTELVEAAPTTLIASVGRVALAGVQTANKVTAATIGGSVGAKLLAMGGTFIMLKKIALGLGLTACLLLAAYTLNGRFESMDNDLKVPSESKTHSAHQHIKEIHTSDIEPLTVEDVVEVAPMDDASIGGLVVDTLGRPLGKWRVFATPILWLKGFGRTTQTVSDEQGAFLISGLKKGQYRLYAMPGSSEDTHFSVRNQQTKIRLAKNENKQNIRLVFDRGLTISGWVVDELGKPIPEAVAFAEPFPETGANFFTNEIMTDNAQNVTDENGRFELMALSDGPYNLRIICDGYQIMIFKEIMAGTDDLMIELKHNQVHVTGNVLEAQGGIPVRLFEIGCVAGVVKEWEPWLEGLNFASVAHANGEFQLKTGLHDGALSLIVRADGYQPELKVIRGIESKSLEGVNIRIKHGLTLKGKVVDTSGALLAGAHVFVGVPPNAGVAHIDYEKNARALTAEDGTFVITSLSPVDSVVSAILRGYPPGIAQIPNNTSSKMEVEIVLPKEGGRIEGIVTLEGEPMAGCQIQVYPVGVLGQQYLYCSGLNTDKNGRFVVENLPETTVEVAAVIDYLEPDSDPLKTIVWLKQDVDAVPGETAQVNLDFIQGNSSIELHVNMEEEASTPPIVRLIAYNGSTQMTWCPTAEEKEGVYILEGVPHGDAELVLGHSVNGEFLEHIDQLQIPSEGTLRHDVHLSN